MRRALPRERRQLPLTLGSLVWLLLSALLHLTAESRAEDAAASVRGSSHEPSQSLAPAFVFARQWPGTLCSQHACPLLRRAQRDRFTILGLRPASKRHAGSDCGAGGGAAAYSAAKLRDLRADLDDAWPSLSGEAPSNDALWAREWNEHGTCSLAVLPDQHTFFEAALRLDRRLSLPAALRRAGVAPSSARAYPAEQLLRALREANGTGARVHCDAQGRLTQVWVCLDLDLSPVDCELLPEEGTECKRPVTLPPLPGTDSDGAWGWLDGADATDAAHHPDGLQQGTGTAAALASPDVRAHPAASDSATGSASTTAAAAAARQPHRAPRRPAGPDSVLRTLCIAGAGATLLCVVALTLASSWARRASLAAAAAAPAGRHSRSASQCSLQGGDADGDGGASPRQRSPAREGGAEEMQDWGAEGEAVVLLFDEPPTATLPAALALQGGDQGAERGAAPRQWAWLGGAAAGGDALRRPLLLP